ncbi:MAG: YgiQ family radical SAM protein [Fibrobacter sp.]|nr:YgiQ family radical SAM protein [Fibrobacter sp.]
MPSISKSPANSAWLPISSAEVQARGWDYLDVIIVSGDAYVDHPSFGHAVIARLLEREGLRVAILPQPNWRDDLRDFKKLGAPRLFFGVTAGCMDSMVNNYTANKRKRSDDAYTPGGKSGFRPDYAATVYTKILKKLYPDIPVILGGIEASLRRVNHYDYWSNSLKPSILASSGADLLIYGMGEQPLMDMLKLLQRGVPLENLRTTLGQCAYLQKGNDEIPRGQKSWEDLILPSWEDCQKDMRKHAQAFRVIENESQKIHARRIIEPAADYAVIVNPPYPPMSSAQLDASFDLPFTRLPHPHYARRGTVPAWEMIKFSINLHRGCFGGCSFCTISAHQGKFIASRSFKSIMQELEIIVEMPEFKGSISDLGGPSANMYALAGKDLEICARCERPSCIFPQICSNLDTNHEPLLKIYRAVRQHPKVKHAFVGSGIRYDLLLQKNTDEKTQASLQSYTQELIQHHVSGRLKVAPEHVSSRVLKLMRKPEFNLFQEFAQEFKRINQQHNLRQQIIPYFISSHPASQLEDMAELAAATKDMGFRLEQVQDFTPTPMTMATTIFATGVHPISLKPIFTAQTPEEKLAQKRFFFWYQPKNRPWIRKTLKQLKMPDTALKLLSNNKR